MPDRAAQSTAESHNYSDRAKEDIAIVQEAMDLWRRTNDSASEDGFTMAESVVMWLYAKGRLT